MEMSHNARVKFKKDLVNRLNEFGVFDSIKKKIKDYNDSIDAYGESKVNPHTAGRGGGNPCHDESGRFCETEGGSGGSALTQKAYTQATGRGGAKKAASDHLMTQAEFIQTTGRGGVKKAASTHPMTQREFIEATGRGGANKAANDHPMTHREFIEATGRGGAKSAATNHPMTDEEFRKAMGFGKKR